MKNTLILCLILIMLLCAGCGAPAATETMKPEDSPSPTIQTTVPPTPEETPEPEELSHYIGYVREPEAYVELSEYLRQFRFGISWETEPNERFVFEAAPSKLTYPLWRAEAHKKPLESDFFQISAVKLAPYNPDKPLPGTERSMGYVIEVRRVEKNPEYTEDNGQPYYKAKDKVERLACSYDILYYLNGYGITEYSYPTTSDNTAFEYYVQVDLDREIAGKKEKGEPWRVYEIYYVDYEAVCLVEYQDIDDGRIR